MFRTSNNRGHQRFDDLRSHKYDKAGKFSLSKKQLQLIEDSEILSLAEKIELLLVALGNKLTAELYMLINYQYSNVEKKELADQSKLDELEALLKELPFVYYQDTLLKKNRFTGKMQEWKWFQVSVNEAVSHFMKDYPDDLTEFEEGVLYGFPLSAIRAFSGLIQMKHDKPSAASYYLAGVCSADFWQDEQDYYQLWWERLRKLSPKIVQEAEEKFQG